MRSRRSASVTIGLVVAFVVAVVAPVVESPFVHAQSRSACGDAAGNVRDQVGGTILGELLPDWIDNPWEPESPGEVWERCIDPYLGGPLPAGYDPGSGRPRQGTNSGDPHNVTQDGALYDFHGAGDFVLLRSPDEGVEAHVRYLRVGAVSTVAGVAVRVGDSTVTVERLRRDEDPLITVDGEQIAIGRLGWFEFDGGVVIVTGLATTLALDSGLIIGAKRQGFTVATPPEWGGTFVGLQGNGDGDPSNDLVLADGTPVDPNDADVLYGAFFDDWYVEPSASFFTTPFDEEADGPIRPEAIVTLADLDEADVATATETCVAAGLVAGSGLEECIFDVAYTGDESWAQDAPAAARTPTVPAAAFTSAVEDRVEVDSSATVAGELTTRFAADEYVVAVADGARYLRVSEPCSTTSGPVAIALVDGVVAGSWPLRCGMRHRLPEESFVLRVIDPYGGTPGYAFAIEPAGVAQLGAVELGVAVEGELAAGDTATGTLDVVTGSRLLIAPAGGRDCATTVSVLDAAGVQQTRPVASCLVNGPFAVTGDGPYSIVATSASGGAYRFVVTQVDDDTTGSTTVGQRVALEVATAGQTASTSIDLVAGQRVYVETLTDVAGDLVLTGPDGGEVARAFSFQDLGLVEATVSGVHTITIVPSDVATGVQTLRVYQVADDTAVAGRVGATVDLAVVTPGQTASVAIDLAAGERVYVETVGDIAGDLVLTGPDGARVAGVFAFRDLGLVTATDAGTYVVTIDAEDATTGTQTLQLRRVESDVEFGIVRDRTNTFRISTPGQVATGTLTLGAGDVLSIERVELVPGRIVVLDPRGEEIASRLAGSDFTVEAPEAGVYSIEFDADDANIGSYIASIDVTTG